MAKRALCVGINNYPGTVNDLHGCVNDAHAWAGVLRDHYDFASGDIEVLLDKEAKKAATMAALKKLVTGAKDGDVLVFSNSSHGTYLPDTSGDEPSGYDQAICPWDIPDHLIVDDELRELFDNLADGVHFTVVSDSCHSGSVLRDLAGMEPPDHRRPRFIPPADLGIALPKAKAADDDRLDPPGPSHRAVVPESSMKALLLAGCKDDQSSMDATLDGDAHGAMTYFALKVLETHDFVVSPSALITELNTTMTDAGFPQQNPQLQGRSNDKKRHLFT